MGSAMRVTALCLSLGTIAAQVEPTEAERAFAAILKHLPEDQARARLAAADPSQVTAGLCRALLQSVIPQADKHRDLAKVAEVENLSIEAAQRGGFTREEAVGHYDIGSALNSLGRFDEAITHFNLALELYQRISAKPEALGNVFANRGISERRMGDYTAALSDFHQAETIFRQLDVEANVARALNNIGLVFEDTGDYRHAMQALEQSLEIAVRHNEVLGQSFVLNNMSGVAIDEGDYDLAASYASRSLKIKETVASKEDLATTLINVGVVDHHAGKDREAEEALKRAIRIGNEAGLKPVEAEGLRELGRLEFDQKRYSAALANLESCMKLSQESGDRLTQAQDWGWMARVRLAMGDKAAALELANRARDLAREIGTTPELLVPSLTAGHIYRTSGRPAQARSALQDAIQATEQIRDTVAGQDSQREIFLAEHTAPYRETTALELQEGHWAAAFAMSERSKGRVLLDLLGGRERAGHMMTVTQAGRETELRGRLASLGAQFRLASSENPPVKVKMRELRTQMDRTYANLAEFRVAFDAANPELSVRRGEVQPVGWTAAADLAADGKTAILDYAVTPAGTYLLVIRRGHPIAAHRIPAADLGKQIAEFREKLATRDPEFPEAASRLYQVLVAPARAELAGISTLIVAPDGDLWQVPFQALRTPAARYLIEDAAVFYAPSLSVVAALRKSARPSSGASMTLAAFGNPTGDWTESEREVGELAALYGSATSHLWVGAQASEDNFRRNAGTYDVVHVAAHGVFDEAHPLRSRLVFHAPLEKGSDGWLQADEIRELEMHAALVVLSGCETGRGSFEEGEGAVGMAWAFLAAGSRAVLASQWRVESTSTTELMARFHSAWRGGSGKAEALRIAALELLRSDRFRHPFYWAGFQLFGDGL
jgi:CHAT domain-containing protein/tetratricopeptide (TPR) repeat protein